MGDLVRLHLGKCQQTELIDYLLVLYSMALSGELTGIQTVEFWCDNTSDYMERGDVDEIELEDTLERRFLDD